MPVTRRVSLFYKLFFFTENDPAAEDEIAVIEDDRLAGRDGALRPVENDPDPPIPNRPNRGRGLGLAVSGPYRRTDRTILLRYREPFEIRLC